MGFFGSIVGKILLVVILLVVVLVGLGVFAYASDYGVQATVQKKQCQASPFTITVKTKVGGLTQDSIVTSSQCSVIEPGNFVIYHLRTKRTVVYEREGGRCIYDSASIACGGSGGGPGLPVL